MKEKRKEEAKRIAEKEEERKKVFILSLNTCFAEYFYVLHSSPILYFLYAALVFLACIYNEGKWETVWILIRWLHQKPADLDLHCSLKG